MDFKMLEIRDAGTAIWAAAFLCESNDPQESYILRRAGFGRDTNLIQIVVFSNSRSCYDPYEWNMARTMRVAHDWVQKNWHEINSGDVVCVEHILGERETPKISERFDSASI